MQTSDVITLQGHRGRGSSGGARRPRSFLGPPGMGPHLETSLRRARDVQVHDTAQGDARAAGLATATAHGHHDVGPGSRPAAQNHLQDRLGKQVGQLSFCCGVLSVI
ncbi:hypothetical protein B566_EDAN004615 [Ephemera danica]|nr:hypothetical protein B566_EDAN004615 [Ephemera danica]